MTRFAILLSVALLFFAVVSAAKECIAKTPNSKISNKISLNAPKKVKQRIITNHYPNTRRRLNYDITNLRSTPKAPKKVRNSRQTYLDSDTSRRLNFDSPDTNESQENTS